MDKLELLGYNHQVMFLTFLNTPEELLENLKPPGYQEVVEKFEESDPSKV